MSKTHDVYRNGKVHLCEEMCLTCVFRPGNLMKLEPDRIEGMISDACKNESAIICHSTLNGPNAVCKGFFDKHKTQSLQIAERLGYLQLVKVS